jgi:glycine/D-amino acid oxidase-like deaminating enzyme
VSACDGLVCELEVEILSPARLAELCPMASTSGATAALWCPTDGYLQPHSLVTAYAGAARHLGVSFAVGTAVTGLRLNVAGRNAGSHAGLEVTGIRTDRGDARTSMVIVAAGHWSATVAGLAGIRLPIVPVRHEYFVTSPVEG